MLYNNLFSSTDHCCADSNINNLPYLRSTKDYDARVNQQKNMSFEPFPVPGLKEKDTMCFSQISSKLPTTKSNDFCQVSCLLTVTVDQIFFVIVYDGWTVPGSIVIYIRRL